MATNVQKNQEIEIKTEENVLISANLTEISINLSPYFLKIAEIRIKLHKEPSYILASTLIPEKAQKLIALGDECLPSCRVTLTLQLPKEELDAALTSLLQEEHIRQEDGFLTLG